MLTLTITALSHAGEGISRHEGRTVFVPLALPGETVRAEIVETKKNFDRARLVEVLTPAPDRIAPPCPHAAPPEGPACGGCQLQHLAYPAQLRFKEQNVREQLTRIGGLSDPPVRAIIPSPQPFHYRNHVQFALTPQGQLGLRAAQSHAVVPIRECLQIEPMLAELLPRIQIEPGEVPALDGLTLRAGEEPLLIFEAEEAPAIELDLPISATFLHPDGSTLPLSGQDAVEITVRPSQPEPVEGHEGRVFQVSAGSFFQVNTALAPTLVELVLQSLTLRGGETVLDLYCGVGLFTAFIAPLAARVIGIEAYAPAVADAAVNLDEFDNVEIYEAPAEVVLPTLELRPDAVVLDPPRAGCAPAVLEALLKLAPARLAYVSCDPATLARDLKRLLAGGYTLEWVQPVDMFPQTYHVECVASLRHAAALE